MSGLALSLGLRSGIKWLAIIPRSSSGRALRWSGWTGGAVFLEAFLARALADLDLALGIVTVRVDVRDESSRADKGSRIDKTPGMGPCYGHVKEFEAKARRSRSHSLNECADRGSPARSPSVPVLVYQHFKQVFM